MCGRALLGRAPPAAARFGVLWLGRDAIKRKAVAFTRQPIAHTSRPQQSAAAQTDRIQPSSTSCNRHSLVLSNSSSLPCTCAPRRRVPLARLCSRRSMLCTNASSLALPTACAIHTRAIVTHDGRCAVMRDIHMRHRPPPSARQLTSHAVHARKCQVAPLHRDSQRALLHASKSSPPLLAPSLTPRPARRAPFTSRSPMARHV